MELRQLSYFVAVAEELHFGRAAAKVRIAQPALSNHVQALERELGCQLFIRTTRRVELTRAGETFYARCVGILSEIDLSAEITRAVAGKTFRKIKIGTVYPATTGVLPAFLAKIAPQVSGYLHPYCQRQHRRHYPQPGKRPDQSRLHPPGGKHRLAALLLDRP
ncbi:regulatory helix-turn-helix LysR family protein [Rhizobium sullae]|uniref:HTH-type transcriptional regulator TtuA n=1 Tax=Rhizobium sullae TaxID=50338 RepID=A0A4V2VAC7_RHISU|nr:regulatory helix-turn-helix LysR family protein [Rhizobium sullae]